MLNSKFLKKIFTQAMFAGLMMAVGMYWYKHNLFPMMYLSKLKRSVTRFVIGGPPIYIPLTPAPLNQKNTLITRYSAGTPVFIDRLYYDSIGDRRLEGLYLVQIPRHHKKSIKISSAKALTIYRLISLNNDNRVFSDYEKTSIKVNVIGHTAVHTDVIKKDFLAGTIILPVGGPITTSPILISVSGQLTPEVGFKVDEIK
ncbi:MAG: hypothetical protein CMH70_00410 [Nitrosomonadaceae bacterium]|nr:hypothetical protein [Nitrosomonadaceae bacterium]